MNFQECKQWTLDKEKGYANVKEDIGGPTNYGITQTNYDSYRKRKGLPVQSIKNISQAEVDEIYNEYWINGKCDKVSSPLNLVLFDTCINFGSGGAIEFLQEALNVTVDGDYGPETETALKSQNLFDTALTIAYSRFSYRDYRVMELASQTKFYAGWINRDKKLLEELKKVDPSPPKNIIDEVIRIAYLEKPPPGYKKNLEVDGPNVGPQVNRFLATAGYYPGAAWCAAFVFYCIRMACYRYEINKIPFETRGRTGYCPYIEDWARAKGILSNTATRGDAILFPASDGVSSHIGMVTKVSGNIVYTIEGNTNEDGSYEGIGIFEKSYSMSRGKYVSWWKLLGQEKEESTGNLYIDNKLIDKLLIKDGVSYAPVKKICEAAGYHVEWNSENKSVYCSKK